MAENCINGGFYMAEKNENNIVFFPKETTYKVGKMTYIVTSHYDENAEPLVEKIKNLLKADIHASGSTSGFPGGNMLQ